MVPTSYLSQFGIYSRIAKVVTFSSVSSIANVVIRSIVSAAMYVVVGYCLATVEFTFYLY